MIIPELSTSQTLAPLFCVHKESTMFPSPLHKLFSNPPASWSPYNL